MGSGDTLHRTGGGAWGTQSGKGHRLTLRGARAALTVLSANRCAAVFMSLQGHKLPPPTDVPAPEEPAASGDGLPGQPEPRVPQVRPVPGTPRPPSRPP